MSNTNCDELKCYHAGKLDLRMRAFSRSTKIPLDPLTANDKSHVGTGKTKQMKFSDL